MRRRRPQLLRRIDLTGRRVNRLLVLRPVVDRFGCFADNPRWLCRCGCGRTAEILGTHLRSGRAASCQRCGRRTRRHDIPGYTTWYGIKASDRCCARWAKSFDAFLEDMGRRPRGQSLSLRDPKGRYTRENCRWALTVNSNSVFLTYRGRTRRMCEWARRWGVSHQFVSYHLYHGKGFERLAARMEGRGKRAAPG